MSALRKGKRRGKAPSKRAMRRRWVRGFTVHSVRWAAVMAGALGPDVQVRSWAAPGLHVVAVWGEPA